MGESFLKDLQKYNRNFFNSDHSITYIGTGSLGGKAQSLAHISNILSEDFKQEDFPQIEVSVPTLTVIRTDVFDEFMKRNDLYEIANSKMEDERIAFAFQKADLPFSILGDLQALIKEVHSPLAVRSSSLLEDAMYEPFAGIYATKMTPNNQHDPDTRFRKLVEAIKFVYASTYFKAAKDYIIATEHSFEEEKMAVIIQEIVGRRYSGSFYPELSGVARSYNFYSMGRAKPEDGVVNLALGLGKTIVDGGVSWAYSPAYPNITPPFSSVGDMLKLTQTEFWAVNMGKPSAYNPIKETEYMLKRDLTVAEKDGNLRYIASTVDNSSGRITLGIGADGPRVLTFGPLLVLNDIPLNNLIKKMLSVCEKVFKAPVEIEFAMTFSNAKDKTSRHRFGFLQVRPMVVSTEGISLENELLTENSLMASENVLGNGIIDSIMDIVYVLPERFEKKHTQHIANELETINRKLVLKNRPYLLIGFGRWGSSDPWLGIPVNWGQVSGAKVIVEGTLENINVELSQGSHFFQNLTSFNISYFSIPFSGEYKIDWNWLSEQQHEEETEFLRHVNLSSPLIIKVDGKRGRGVIYKF